MSGIWIKVNNSRLRDLAREGDGLDVSYPKSKQTAKGDYKKG